MPAAQEPLYLPVSLVSEIAYCPYNFYLRAVQGADAKNVFMVKGALEEHLRNRQRSRRMPGGEERVYSVMLSSESLNLIGVIDLLVLQDLPIPVEFKTGKYTEEHPAHEVQVCLQALLLEENFQKTVPFGYVYYVASRKRRQVPITHTLRERAFDVLEQARQILEGEWVPDPQPRESCVNCALYSQCMPFETQALKEKLPEDLVIPQSRQVTHRVLYVDTPGTFLGKEGMSIKIRRPGEMFDLRVPLTQIDQIVLLGNVQVSTQLLRVLLSRGIPVVYLSGRGRFTGIALPEANRNITLRLAQFQAYHNPERRLELAKAFVAGKIRNQRHLLRRHPSPGRSDRTLQILQQLRLQALAATNLEELRGLEGTASRLYFRALGALFPLPFEFRSKRPPRDPVNATLSLLYTLLFKDVVHLVHTVGLDPYLGFLHGIRYGRPALALDLMEEFRPLLADAVALTLWRRRQLKPKDFSREFGGVYLKEEARKRLFDAYEKKKRESIQHPRFGYRLPYFRHMEMQIRLLGKVLLGEIPRYLPFHPK